MQCFSPGKLAIDSTRGLWWKLVIQALCACVISHNYRNSRFPEGKQMFAINRADTVNSVPQANKTALMVQGISKAKFLDARSASGSFSRVIFRPAMLTLSGPNNTSSLLLSQENPNSLSPHFQIFLQNFTYIVKTVQIKMVEYDLGTHIY